MAKQHHLRHPRYRGDQPGEGQPSADGWQIVYTGFILILLCFFIMLTSFASLQQAKVTRFVRSFSAAVSILEGGLSADKGETVLSDPGQVVEKEARIAKLFDQVKVVAAAQQLGRQVSIEQTSRGVVLTLEEGMLFALGSAQLTAASQQVLDKVAAIVAAVPATVRIEGHTDDLPIRSARYPSNWHLSAARATAVLRRMLEQYQVAPHRLIAVGYGSHQPRVPNDSSEHRAMNRRVEFVFVPSESR